MRRCFDFHGQERVMCTGDPVGGLLTKNNIG